MSSSGASALSDQDDTKPLWKYVKRVEKLGGGGGNTRFQCNFCQRTFTGSYYRVKAHLMRNGGQGIKVCPKVTFTQLAEMQKAIDEVEMRSKPTQVPLPSSSSNTQQSSFANAGLGLRKEGFEPKKRKAAGNSPLEKAFNMETQDQLKGEISRMFYSSGLPFHLARNPYYVSSYTFAANNMICGFVPLGYNALRTTLLKKERANIEKLLEPIKSTWKEKRISIVTDGWSDAQRRPLINFMAVTESGPVFLKAINCEGEYKDKFYIAGLIKDTIAEVGPQNVVQVITDNAPVCKSAGMLIESQYPHVFWTPCVVHSLNLALRNICAAVDSQKNEATYVECHWITEVSGDAILIKNFIMSHQMRLAIFNEFVTLKLLAVAETRFASMIIMLRRFKLIKHGLQAMVIGDRWSSYREDDVGKATFVKEKVLSDVWWGKIDYILSFTGPIYNMLWYADTDKPALHLIYDMWDSMIENVKKAIYKHEGNEEYEDSTFYSVVHAILVDRWNKNSTPLHCLAHSLNPRYYSEKWLNEAPNRVPPHKDLEIQDKRNKCLRRYFPNAKERRMAILEYARFSGVSEGFSSFDCLHDRGVLDSKAWWMVYGAAAPLLQNIALKLLGQPCSSSCCKRNWSTYAFIHSIKRNKIQPQRAEDLVFVHTNIRLLSRKTEHDLRGPSKI